MNNKLNVGGIVTPQVVGGVISNRPPHQQGQVQVPGLNDMKAIEAQREALRQEELARSQRQNGN
jgi:hypothetical protein